MEHRHRPVSRLTWAAFGALAYLVCGPLPAAGIKSGPELSVAQDTAALSGVALAGNPDNQDYLVVWTRSASSDAASRLMGQRMTAKRRVGAAFVLREFNRDETGPSATQPGEHPEISLIFGPSKEYLLAYSVKGLDGQFKEIRIARLGANAAAVTEDIPVTTSAGAQRPSVAGYYGAYLITWTEPAGIVGRLYRPASNQPLGPIEIYSTAGSDFSTLGENLELSDSPFIAFQGLAARRLKRGGIAQVPALSLVPIDPLGLATDAPSLLARGAEQPAVTISPSNGRATVIWAQTAARGARRVAVARLRANRPTLNPPRILAERAASPTIRASGRDGETLALWVKQASRRIQGQLLLPGLEAKSVVTTFGRRRFATLPSLAMSADRKLALVAWAENGMPGRRNRITIQNLDTSGNAASMTIRMTPSEQQLSFKSSPPPSSGSGTGGTTSGAGSPGPKKLSYTVTVSNTSAVLAEAPSVSLELGELQQVGFSDDVKCTGSKCDLPRLAPGASLQFKVSGQISYSGCAANGAATAGRQAAEATLTWGNAPDDQSERQATAADVALTC